jgi:undecaprenyl pyrophosphate synthase
MVNKGYISKIIIELKPPLLTTYGGRDALATKIRKVIHDVSKKSREVTIIFEE